VREMQSRRGPLRLLREENLLKKTYGDMTGRNCRRGPSQGKREVARILPSQHYIEAHLGDSKGKRKGGRKAYCKTPSRAAPGGTTLRRDRLALSIALGGRTAERGSKRPAEGKACSQRKKSARGEPPRPPRKSAVGS